MSDTLTGLYDGAGFDVDGHRPPLVVGGENFVQHLRARPVGLVLGNFRMDPLLLDFIWMMPPGPDPLPIPERTFALIVDALEKEGAVLLQATHEAAIDAVKAAVLPMVGGGRA